MPVLSTAEVMPKSHPAGRPTPPSSQLPTRPLVVISQAHTVPSGTFKLHPAPAVSLSPKRPAWSTKPAKFRGPLVASPTLVAPLSPLVKTPRVSTWLPVLTSPELSLVPSPGMSRFRPLRLGRNQGCQHHRHLN